MDNNRFKRTKYTCYFTYLAMSCIFTLPPLLFATFRETYGISYTLLGTLVLTNFCTQLTVDLIFSFFAKHFNIHKIIRMMPLITTIGLVIYALVPTLLPQYAYAGLLVGTVIFSISAGMSEVLLSPLVAAIPSETPDRDMSMLHSLYAYGVLSVVIISTVFLRLFGTENWMYLTLLFALFPLIDCVLFHLCPLPDMDVSQGEKSGKNRKRAIGLTFCALCIFLGSAAENTMTNWISVYMESALNVPKALGDILGLALYAVLLGLGRTLYAKYGKNIGRVLLVSMIGAVVCYLLVGLSMNVIVSMVACVFTGLTTSLLWPGTLILMEENVESPGVVAYALMAAAGDFGASVAPQLLGVVVDTVALSNWASAIGAKLALSPEQVGMKVGMLMASCFPILGVGVLLVMLKHFAKRAAVKKAC